MLSAGTARAIINPPLSLEHGEWGAKTHVTPRGIDLDLWATCLALTDGASTAVLIDLDQCTIANDRADRLRSRIATALGIESWQVRVSVTHTHSGPMLRADDNSTNPIGEENYIAFVEEQCVGIAVGAMTAAVPVSARSQYGICTIGQSRRQRMPDGLMVAGFAPDRPADPTVAVVRFDDEAGNLVASLVHYAAHPTTLGYTNDLVSPDYPGVTKRFVEATIGGTCLFLQGAAGDIGPGPGGFLSNLDVVRSIGTQLGCAASQALLEAEQEQFEYRFDKLVRSGADLGVWKRNRRPLADTRLIVHSEAVDLPLQEQPDPELLRAEVARLRDEYTALHAAGAPGEAVADIGFQLKRADMALKRAEVFYGMDAYPLEVHIIAFDDTALIGVPIEAFSETGKQIRSGSPFRYTLFSGYSNGRNGYLPTPQAAAEGGYEVGQMSFRHESAPLLANRIVGMLQRLPSLNPVS